MDGPSSFFASPDPWAGLRAFTAARIGLGRTGTSVPLREALAFRLAHAHARDAVYSELETARGLAIRPEGLPYAAADDQLFLLQEALRRQLSGVALKDETGLLGI
jgi:ethanolamine ammonia-lyase small subunit